MFPSLLEPEKFAVFGIFVVDASWLLIAKLGEHILAAVVDLAVGIDEVAICLTVGGISMNTIKYKWLRRQRATVFLIQDTL